MSMKKEVDAELNKLDNLLIEAKDTNGKCIREE